MSSIETAWLVSLVVPVTAAVLAYLGVRATATATARKTASDQSDRWHERVVNENTALNLENERHELRITTLESELVALQRRIGTYEADIARLGRENESLRSEVDRLASELTAERMEKQQYARDLGEARREGKQLADEVARLTVQVAELKACRT